MIFRIVLPGRRHSNTYVRRGNPENYPDKHNSESIGAREEAEAEGETETSALCKQLGRGGNSDRQQARNKQLRDEDEQEVRVS